MVSFRNANITQKNSLGINFAIAHTSVTLKNCFRIICVFISGLILFLVGLVFGIFEFEFLSRGIFSRIVSLDFSPHFCGKECPETSSRKIPGKILKHCYNKNPRHFSSHGARAILDRRFRGHAISSNNKNRSS